jgi:hypothetical protein
MKNNEKRAKYAEKHIFWHFFVKIFGQLKKK